MELSKDKQQIKKIIQLNDELENYFRNTIIPQLFVDANLILRKYTPPAMKQFKFTQDNIGKSIHELIDNIRYSTLIENIQEVIHTGEIFEKEIQTTDLKWFQMNILPYIIQKENKTNGVIITFIDITDRIKDIKELERLNEMHETFTYSVSHDLLGPLSNIEVLIQNLISFKEEEDKQSIAEMLARSVESMRKIITELSDITKIESNYQESTEKVNFSTIFKEVELILQDKIRENDAKITIDIQAKEIEFSRKNLRSIIYNLMSNAIKYRSQAKSPEISIQTIKESGFVALTIKDNGLGIAEDQKELIFSKFTRVVKNVEGSGIGLYLVKKIIDNEGGKIIVNSEIGNGAEFKVYLRQTSKI